MSTDGKDLVKHLINRDVGKRSTASAGKGRGADRVGFVTQGGKGDWGCANRSENLRQRQPQRLSGCLPNTFVTKEHASQV